MPTPSMAARLYAEVSLGKGPLQTRILELQPNVKHPDIDIVECTLRPFDLNDAQEYTALSYCWGEQNEDKVVHVNGLDIVVTGNLESALRQLRNDSRHVLVWVDAICINQHDAGEKGQQMAQMHEIFQQANRTVAWLGDDHEDGEFALNFLHWFEEKKLNDEDSETSFDWDLLESNNEQPEWRAVDRLLSRPYWRRLWVMQELALSKQEPEFACGNARLPWNLLFSALKIHKFSYHIARFSRVREMVPKPGAGIDKSQRLQLGRYLMWLLSQSAAFRASEPRDKVYALYGLLKTGGVDDIVPDYSLPVADVYKQMTLLAMTYTSSLDVLELKPWDQDPLFPSWVVDFSKVLSIQLPQPKECLWQRHPLSETSPCQNNDGLGTDENFMSVTLGSVTTTGTIVDRITTVHHIDACVRHCLGQPTDSDFHKSGPSTLRAMPAFTGEFPEYSLNFH